MIYKYIRPGFILQDFVRDYLVAHLIFEKDEPIPFKAYAPKPEQGITFFIKGFVTIVDETVGQVVKAPGVSVFGQQVSRYNFYLTQEYLILRVHFLPGALFRLLGIPLSEFTNQYCDASAIINYEIEEVNNQLAECENYEQMIQTVELYLVSKIKKIK